MSGKVSDLLTEYAECFSEHCTYMSCADGWYDIIKACLDRVREDRQNLLAVTVVQIKEKFGGLRFYIRGAASLQTRETIRSAEDESFSICEVTGLPGKLHVNGGYIRTLNEEYAANDKSGNWRLLPERSQFQSTRISIR
jgi:hypothetical protein